MLLISDLHLEPDREDISRSLFDLLRNRATAHEELYILGDLFEVWIGDDDVNPLAEQVAGELRKLSTTGTKVFLMHGNRDFLLGQDFARRCGATLLDEPHLLKIGEQRFALLHGDVLCTGDTDYMEFRALVRTPDWQTTFLAKSLPERRLIAQQARTQSALTTSNKAMAIMDVSTVEVDNLMQDLQVTTLIHGHTHRPAVHTMALQPIIRGHSSGQRVVLGDWNSQGWCVELSASGVNLQHFPLLP